MSRFNKTVVNDLGLSRQSSRSYNVVNRKWNVDLDKTLRQLDVEHQTNISKILNERFDLKNVHHALKSESDSLAKREKTDPLLPVINFTASDSFMECASFEMGNNEVSENVCELANSEIAGNAAKSLEGSHKAQRSQSICRLPSIAEEILSQRRLPRSPRSDHRLPPLPVDVLPSRSRKHSDRHKEKPVCRTRQRSSTLPVGATAEDRWRKVHSPFSSPDLGSLRKEKRTQDDDFRPAEVLSSTWPTDLENCRYLRRRAVTSPDRLDVESIFRD